MFSRSPVYPASDITEKLGGVLDLVEDGGGAKLVQESVRIGLYPRHDVRILQEHV
jgi:hypothetical protein